MNAHVRNGKIELDEPVQLPEGAALIIHMVPSTEDSDGTTFIERMGRFAGTINDLPEDMALNHDHYLHGAPKK